MVKQKQVRLLTLIFYISWCYLSDLNFIYFSKRETASKNKGFGKHRTLFVCLSYLKYLFKSPSKPLPWLASQWDLVEESSIILKFLEFSHFLPTNCPPFFCAHRDIVLNFVNFFRCYRFFQSMGKGLPQHYPNMT